jgi:hypothetical protein
VKLGTDKPIWFSYGGSRMERVEVAHHSDLEMAAEEMELESYRDHN